MKQSTTTKIKQHQQLSQKALKHSIKIREPFTVPPKHMTQTVNHHPYKQHAASIKVRNGFDGTRHCQPQTAQRRRPVVFHRGQLFTETTFFAVSSCNQGSANRASDLRGRLHRLRPRASPHQLLPIMRAAFVPLCIDHLWNSATSPWTMRSRLYGTWRRWSKSSNASYDL